MNYQPNIHKYAPDYRKRTYIMSILIALDQLVNAFLGGYPDETLSSRAYRNSRIPNAKLRWVLSEKIINKLFFWDNINGIAHCEMSYLAEVLREHLPRENR